MWNDKMTVLPMHGKGKEIGKGLEQRIKKDLGLKWERTESVMLRYSVKLSRDTNGTILVDVPAIPEAHTFGEDRDEALSRAVDAIETALMGYIQQRRPIPASSSSGKVVVTLPALTEAKVALYSAMLASGTGKAELARRLNCHLPQVDRLLDLNHASRLDQLESASRAVGKRLLIDVHDAIAV